MNYCQFRNDVIKRMCNSGAKASQYVFGLTVPSAPTIQLFYQQSVANSAEIDWGDGTKSVTSTTTNSRQSVSHTYASGGAITITVTLLKGVNDFRTIGPSWAANTTFMFVSVDGWMFTLIHVPDGVTALTAGMFNGKANATTDIQLPDSIINIGERVFYNCPIGDVPMPLSLQTIGVAAFYNDTTRTSVEFPASLTSIGEAAFRYSTGIASVTFNSLTPPTIGANAFGNINNSAKVYIPTGTTSAYTTAFAGTGLQNKTIIEV